jgi:hypothetical protein
VIVANIFCEESPAPWPADILWSTLDILAAQRQADHRKEVGHFFIDKYRSAAPGRGYGAVARQLKKQGVPLHITLKLLGIKERA